MTYLKVNNVCLNHLSLYRVVLAVLVLATISFGILAHTLHLWSLISVPRDRLGTILRWSLQQEDRTLLQPECAKVLTNMVKGHWVQRPASKSEVENIQSFLYIVREHHSLPYNLQRSDNRCGNVTFEGLTDNKMKSLFWFRALCDPDSDMACCYDNMCTAKSVGECTCRDCYDLRQRIHAELAEWTPSDATCKMVVFENVEEICQTLHGMTIYFVGDSLVRHLYVAMLQLVRADTSYGPLMEHTPPDMTMACNEQTIYLGKCANVLDRETWECQHTVKLKYMDHAKISQNNLTLEAMEDLRNVSNNMVVLGVGVHDNFDAQKVTDGVLLPVWETLMKMAAPRPTLLWFSVHSPGLLKTPRVDSQSRENVEFYNSRLRKVLRRYSIPEFNTFDVTNGIMSYDGIHYGKGVNHVKAQIFLNYILDYKTNQSRTQTT